MVYIKDYSLVSKDVTLETRPSGLLHYGLHNYKVEMCTQACRCGVNVIHFVVFV